MVRLTSYAGGVLLLLYGTLFVLLQLQDFALLVGTGVLLYGLDRSNVCNPWAHSA